jgi:hypothetical protein
LRFLAYSKPEELLNKLSPHLFVPSPLAERGRTKSGVRRFSDIFATILA